MTVILASLTSMGVALLVAYLVRLLAPRLGLVDAPDGQRKLQAAPVPVGGGLAVLAGLITGGLFGVSNDLQVNIALSSHFDQWMMIFVGAFLIVSLGLYDDCRPLRPRWKLLGQLAVITLVLLPGELVIRQLSIFGTTFQLGYLAIPITYFWFLAAINSLNLIDGMDGMLGSVTVIACVALAIIGVMTGQPMAVIIGISLAGATTGFLRYNLPPATIYLGDSGSMLIGLMIASVGLLASMKSTTISLLAPVTLLIVPIVDTSAAIVRRKLSGKGFAMADRDHLHHVLQRREGWSTWTALKIVWTLTFLAACGAVSAIYLKIDLLGIFGAATVIGSLVTFGLFGIRELKLIRDRALRGVRLLPAPPAEIRHELEPEPAQ